MLDLLKLSITQTRGLVISWPGICEDITVELADASALYHVGRHHFPGKGVVLRAIVQSVSSPGTVIADINPYEGEQRDHPKGRVLRPCCRALLN